MLVKWPDKRPCDPYVRYWTRPLNTFDYAIRKVYDWRKEPSLYLELGSFCGASALTLAQMTGQDVSIVCIDTWDNRGGPQYDEEFGDNFALFKSNLWDYRERVTMIQDDTLSGMRLVAEMGVVPDVVFIDADHAYEAVKNDSMLAKELWPDAQICGDDWNEVQVRQAVVEVFGKEFGVIGCQFWWEIKRNFDAPLPADFFQRTVPQEI